jgi:uncharacterized protein YgbK (DUF1537 family)
MFIGAIADDLTGGTDLALTLSREGLRVLQVVGVPRPGTDFGDAEAVVVSLKSRTIPAAEAVELSRQSAERLLEGGARQLFFKYCSTFDSTDAGNIGPVTDALLDLLGETRTIACPAFPTNKRTVYKGHLFVGDVLLSDSPMKDHPLTPMRDANLVRVLQRQTSRPVSLVAHETVSSGAETLEAAIGAQPGIAIVDAITDADLRTIGRAVRGLRLVTGGSGVALGLPANFGADARTATSLRMRPAAGHSVILAGSCSVATRRQIEVARSRGVRSLQIDAMAVADGSMTVSEAVAFALADPAAGPALLYSSADPSQVATVQTNLGTHEAGDMLERFFASVARELRAKGVTRFLVAGGETSGAVVAALGVNALQIGPEIDPGVPWTLSHGAGEPIALGLKSGNFGADDFFLKAWDHFNG